MQALIGANVALALQDVPAQIYAPTQKSNVSGRAGGQGLKPRNTREPDRDDFMVMKPFHSLLKYAAKESREAGRHISSTNLLKVRGLG